MSRQQITFVSRLSHFCRHLLPVVLLVPMCAAQFRVTDNFNRANGPVGLGWSTYGNGAQISSNQLETFGEFDLGGGIQRNVNVSFPLQFSFDISTADPSDGGWVIGFNATSEGFDMDNDTSEVILYQFSGSRQVCILFQSSTGPSTQCASLVTGQRDFTAQALVVGTLNADFSASVKIKFNDGLMPGAVTINSSAPTGAVQTPLGDVLFFGNVNNSTGPDTYDNFVLTLM
jgi:hypothetical protein